MKKILQIIIIVFVCQASIAQDTFSIVALDPLTGEIGSAAASCVDGITDPDFIDFLTRIIPNRGGIMSQALICVPNPNLANAATQMEAGLSPLEIIDYLLANDVCSAGNFNPEERQYGIVDFDGQGGTRAAGFTGSLNQSYAEHRLGPSLTVKTYSIQGNILADVSVIDNMENNFNNTNGTLADKLMAALQGANFPGADSRCLSDGTSSKLAYLMVYRPDDDPADPYLRLSVPSQPAGVEPIDVLQSLYDNFLSLDENDLKEQIRIFPNPTTSVLTIRIDISEAFSGLTVTDIFGKMIIDKKHLANNGSRYDLDIRNLQSGIYFLKVKTFEGNKIFKFIKK
ncbi:MAG: DUF1028 domain-containing protein [Flavobacteriaceae bacterium]|nr:DUF1028 domain-containing protein [Flavobacteriaceae bacterium]